MFGWRFPWNRPLSLERLVTEGESCLQHVTVLGAYRKISQMLDGGSDRSHHMSESTEFSVRLTDDRLKDDPWMEQWRISFAELMKPVADVETRRDQVRAMRRALLDITGMWCLTSWLAPKESGDRLNCSLEELERLRRLFLPGADGHENLGLLAAQQYLAYHLSLIAAGGIAMWHGGLPDQAATNRYTECYKAMCQIALMSAKDQEIPADFVSASFVETFLSSLKDVKEQLIDRKTEDEVDWGGLEGLGEG